MTSFNTVTYPTEESNVTNVCGDHLTFHTGDVIIVHYHVHPPAVVPVDRDHTGTTGGDQSESAGLGLEEILGYLWAVRVPKDLHEYVL
ncbi:hypothetical protein FIBSPDRAFT_946338 [Athelia psychrophila]|uniref:Uncharacterized protein n=1 Tax=Athelia psychrophila TaxID=1759441 RepID=A0A166STU3_9AGAM|nr:hypothetical protein FIBSPDRAFT_946338 [Fibularhizoctonia sp. CBS 109695]